MGMTLELTGNVETQLRDLASKQGRNVRAVFEDAVREDLETIAITDLEPAEVAEAQVALVSELGELPEWKGGDA